VTSIRHSLILVAVDTRLRPTPMKSDWPEFIAAIVTDAGNREERIVQIRKRLNSILLNV